MSSSATWSNSPRRGSRADGSRGCGPGSAGWLRGPDGWPLGSGRPSSRGAREPLRRRTRWSRGTPRGRTDAHARGGDPRYLYICCIFHDARGDHRGQTPEGRGQDGPCGTLHFWHLSRHRVPSGKAPLQSSSVYGVLLNAFEGLSSGFDCQMNVSMPASRFTPLLVTRLSPGSGRDSMG